MAIEHKFLSELSELESNQMFCGESLYKESNLLIIGSFNPDNKSCLKKNGSDWFYGRTKNFFWEYLPGGMTGENLHIKNGGEADLWKSYCKENKVIIVDLIKKIEDNVPLKDFSDKELDNRIEEGYQNVDLFDFKKAFEDIQFKKVIYTRKGWDPKKNKDISKLIKIKDSANSILIENKIIKDYTGIKYCPAPWQKRSTTKAQWFEAINQ